MKNGRKQQERQREKSRQPHGVGEPTGLHCCRSSSHLSFLTAARPMHSELSNISFFHLEGGNGRRETQREKRDRQRETETKERDKGRETDREMF